MTRYTKLGNSAKYNAQRNLNGRTHYVEDATLKFHHSRINHTWITDNGLLFALVESVSLDMDNSNRGYRFVVFDVFGTVIERPKLEDTYKTGKQAEKAMWAYLNEVDAMVITKEGIDRYERNAAQDVLEMRKNLLA